MSHGIYIALSGALAQSTTLDTAAANLANSSTTGFQKSTAVFREVLTAQRDLGTYTKPGGVALDRRPGALRTTGRPLDVAFPKDAYLAVQTENGERYTRDGALTVGSDGTVKTMRGQVVLGDGGAPIVANASSGIEVRVDPSGQVLQGGRAIGRLRVLSFPGAGDLVHEGANLLVPSPSAPASPAPSTAPVEVGVLEESNASPVETMTSLVSASRAFEAFERAIQAFHEADRKVISSVPGT